jgi:hypothetical protein
MGIETLAIASLGASVAGAAVGAAGASTSAKANKEAAFYKAAVARNNQIIGEQNAQAAIQTGDANAEASGLKARAAVGTVRAVGAANGLDVNTGTEHDLQTSTDAVHMLDTLTIRNAALMAARGYKQQAANAGSESQLDMMAGRNAALAGEYGVASSLLGGATSFSDKWMTYSNRGIFG